MAQNDRDDRIKKIKAIVQVTQLLSTHPTVATAIGVQSADNLARLSEPDLIEIERRLGGRVT